MKTDLSLFRKNLIKVRVAKGVSARELSVQSNLRQFKRISDIEEGRGNPSLEEICSICKTLGYSIDEMIYKEAIVNVSWIDTINKQNCNRYKDEGILCDGDCYFKSSGLKTCNYQALGML